MTSDTTLPLCPLQPSNPHLWHLTLLILLFSSPPLTPGRGRELRCRSWQSPVSSSSSFFLSLSLRGWAACSGKNLCGDRCAYQTPALSPVPRESYNYLLARLHRLSSNLELNLLQRTLLLAVATVAGKTPQRAGLSSTYCHLFITRTFCIPSAIIHTIKTHWNRSSWQGEGVRGGDLSYFELFM